MSKKIKAGIRLNSAVCQTQIMALRVPDDELEITCGGVLMSAQESTGNSEISDALTGGTLAGGTLVGKRYVDEGETMEFLCTRSGKGNLQANGVALAVKQAKALPSSD